jgi:hypothetical protein
MKRFYSLLFLVLIGTLIFPLQGSATLFPNPAPGILGDDLDDPGIFSHELGVLNIEIFDLLGTLTGSLGLTFGFYFDGTPDNLITIFDALDQGPVTVDDGTIPQVAAIDFVNGAVYDVDDAIFTEDPLTDHVQDVFDGNGNIGFFLSLFLPESSSELTVFTDPSLNSDGVDFAATYPLLGAPDDWFVLGFWLENENFPGGHLPLAFEFAAGITPVPEPATFLLLGTGLLGLAGGLRRKLKKS